MHQGQRTLGCNLPVSSGPPICPTECLNGLVTWRCRHGRIKFKPINISIAREVKTTYWICMCAMQPPANDSKRLIKVVGPGPQHDQMKIKPVNVKIKHINEKPTWQDKMTYRILARATQPPRNSSKRACWVIGPRHQCGCIKIEPRNINRTQMNGNAHLRHVNAIWSLWRPKKRIRKINNLTFESRMPGELWHDVEDHGWGVVRVAINRRHMGTTRLPNLVMMRMSRKRHKPSQQQVSYSIWIRHIPLQQHLFASS